MNAIWKQVYPAPVARPDCDVVIPDEALLRRVVSEWMALNRDIIEDGGEGDIIDLARRIAPLVHISPDRPA